MPFLTLEEVLAAHARVKAISLASAPDHVHRMDMLESAIARPQNAAAYEGADLVARAATLMWGLVRDHPFSDGNKRTALIATIALLDINDHVLDMSDDEKFELVIGIANGGVTVEQTADALRRRMRPRRGDHAIGDDAAPRLVIKRTHAYPRKRATRPTRRR